MSRLRFSFASTLNTRNCFPGDTRHTVKTLHQLASVHGKECSGKHMISANTFFSPTFAKHAWICGEQASFNAFALVA